MFYDATVPVTDQWHESANQEIVTELGRAGYTLTGDIETSKVWGRSCVKTAPTTEGTVWIKYAYRLPPGEEVVVQQLATRHTGSIPRLVAAWPGALATLPLPGPEMEEDASLDDWCQVADTLGHVLKTESSQVEHWLALGTRDRRPAAYREALETFAEGEVFHAADTELKALFHKWLPDLKRRYVDNFTAPATLVHQDPGCCNVALADDGPVLFDWSDVVVGHPAFSCDRLLDQVPHDWQDQVVRAFIEPLGLALEEFTAMRRSNVMHEILRYHDELAYLSPEFEIYPSLVKSVQSQLGVMLHHEEKRGTS